MPPAKRDESRATRRRSNSEQPPASRRWRGHWVVRSIGAAKRRSKNSAEIAASETRTAHIIRLSCADTFSRPVCPGAVGTISQLVPFRARAKGDAQQVAPR